MRIGQKEITLNWIENNSYTGYKFYYQKKNYYLGRNEPMANKKAREIVERVEQKQPVVTLTKLTVSDALTEFIKQSLTRPISPAWKVTLEYRSRMIRKLVNLDVPVDTIDYDVLTTWINKIMSGPNSQTGKNLLQVFRQFIQWLDESGRWIPPFSLRRWERLFSLRGKLRRTHSLTRSKLLDLATFAKIYLASDRQLRGLMMMAINSGGTQTDLASLEHSMISDGRLTRERQKTGISSSWVLWQRTLRDIDAAQWPKKPKNKLVFVSKRGNPMLHYGASYKTDAIGQRWCRQLKRMELPAIGFRMMRKLGAQMVRETAGLEVSQLYLAHSGQSVAEKHYVLPVHEKLDEALRIIELRVEDAIKSAEIEKVNKTLLAKAA